MIGSNYSTNNGNTFFDIPGNLLYNGFYNGTQTEYITHKDWLGSERFWENLTTRTENGETAFSPYGDHYATVGNSGSYFEFSGIKAFDGVGGIYDAPNRSLMATSGRWLSPDPAYASWNAYGYVTDPNTETDISGLGADEGLPGNGTLPDAPSAVGATCSPGDHTGRCQWSPDGPAHVTVTLIFDARLRQHWDWFGGGDFWGPNGVRGSDASLALVGRAIANSVSAGVHFARSILNTIGDWPNGEKCGVSISCAGVPAWATPEFAAEGTGVLFGQASVARTFTTAERGSTFEFAGQSITDVAAGLRSGAISPGQIPVRVVNIEGQLVAVNNRSLTALKRAGMQPTNIIDLSSNAGVVQKVRGRLDAMGGVPSQTIRIRGAGPDASAIF